MMRVFSGEMHKLMMERLAMRSGSRSTSDPFDVSACRYHPLHHHHKNKSHVMDFSFSKNRDQAIADIVPRPGPGPLAHI